MIRATIVKTPKRFSLVAKWCRENGVPLTTCFKMGDFPDWFFSSKVMTNHYPSEFPDGSEYCFNILFRERDWPLLRIRFPEIELEG
jgi:hypothetical protein